MKKAVQRLAALCMTVTVLGVLADSAWGATSDPVLVLTPAGLTGPCGLAVSSSGDFYVSNYYADEIDIFNSAAGQPQSNITNVDPTDGPCGLAFNSSGALYVNNFHRNVLNLTAGTTLPLPEVDPAHHFPTGVAIDSATNHVYVDNRTYLSVFDTFGAPVMEGAEPLRIGVGSIGEGYGLAVSAYPSTVGRVYVPDAVSNTVKVFDPSVSKVTPVATIRGPGKGFSSLHDSSIAIDRVTGNIYVIDNLQSQYTEEPEAAVDIFNSSNAFLGVLKYKIFDALPPGIAVDNSTNETQGRVYVTSGNTDKAGVYVYAPGSQTNGFLPPSIGLTVKATGSGGTVSSNIAHAPDCSGSCTLQPLAGSEVTLTATPDHGSTFGGWSGACSGSDSTCTVQMQEAVSVEAAFDSVGPTTSPESVESSITPVPQVSSPGVSPRLAHRPHHRRRHKHRRHRIEHHR